MPQAMNPASARMEHPHILIVDDDEEVRTALSELFLSVGLDATAFSSTRDLLDANLPRRPGCIVLDVRMPGASGLDLQNHLATKGDAPPIIFLSGYGDIPMTVKAMKAGAVDFLTKPVRDQTLLDAVTAYMQLWRDMQVVQVRESNVRVITQQLRAAEDRFEVGEATRTDVAQSRSRLALARSSLQSAQAQLIASKENYIALVGKPPQNLEVPPALPGLPESAEAAVALALDMPPPVDLSPFTLARQTKL